MPTWKSLKSPSNQHFECFLLITLIVLIDDRLLKHMNLLTVYHYVLFLSKYYVLFDAEMGYYFVLRPDRWSLLRY